MTLDSMADQKYIHLHLSSQHNQNFPGSGYFFTC